jgi:hypothetical protein
MTTTDTKATARPWQVNPTGDIGEWFIGNSKHGIAECQSQTNNLKMDCANAALIVRAVNQFEALNAVAEAAKTLRWAHELLSNHVKEPADHEIYQRNLCEAQKELDKALSALEAIRKQTA